MNVSVVYVHLSLFGDVHILAIRDPKVVKDVLENLAFGVRFG